MGDDLAIRPRVRRAIDLAHERGVAVTIATGRMLQVARPYAQELGISAPLICYQGGLIQAAGAASPLFITSMDAELVRETLSWASARGWHAVLYTESEAYAARGPHPTVFHEILSREQIVWVDSLLQVLERYQPVKLIFIDNQETADTIETDMLGRFEDRLVVVRSHRSVVEGSPVHVSKGDGLRRLAEHLAIPQTETMAIGDQDNDVSMVAWAGIGVAMGDGSPAVRAAADWVAPPFAEDGAAVAIERFVLGGGPASTAPEGVSFAGVSAPQGAVRGRRS